MPQPPNTPRNQPQTVGRKGIRPPHGRKRNQHFTPSSKVFNRTGVGAYRIRPPRGRTTQSNCRIHRRRGGFFPHFRAYAIRPYSFPDGKQIHYNPIKRGFLTENNSLQPNQTGFPDGKHHPHPMKGLPIKNRSLETPELFRFCFQ